MEKGFQTQILEQKSKELAPRANTMKALPWWLLNVCVVKPCCLPVGSVGPPGLGFHRLRYFWLAHLTWDLGIYFFDSVDSQLRNPTLPYICLQTLSPQTTQGKTMWYLSLLIPMGPQDFSVGGERYKTFNTWNSYESMSENDSIHPSSQSKS